MMKHLLILSFLFLHITTGYSQQSDLQRNDVLKGTVTANGKIIPALFSVWRMREGEPYGYVRIGSDTYGQPAIDTTTVGTIVIPEEITGPDGRSYHVKAIARQAFAHCRHITEVVIHNRLTHIGDQAFLGCESLTHLSLPASTEVIYPCAFRDCPKLNVIQVNCHRLPDVYSDIFDRHTMEHGTLFIPYGTSALYSDSQVWGLFRHRFELVE
ncbi:MAG: leucine-rich repeat protein [Prevotella sp.]|nr:leucine-rich repeat protein [Prevotella sp.]